MLFQLPDISQDDEAWPQDEVGAFIYVPLAWRTGQHPLEAQTGAKGEIEEALKDLHASYVDLPIPDHLLDLVRQA
jgi:hypothetical protein